MTESSVETRRKVRSKHRAEAITRIYQHIGMNTLTDLPDVFLVIIERALARDMNGVREFSFNPGYHFLSPPGVSPHE